MSPHPEGPPTNPTAPSITSHDYDILYIASGRRELRRFHESPRLFSRVNALSANMLGVLAELPWLPFLYYANGDAFLIHRGLDCFLIISA